VLFSPILAVHRSPLGSGCRQLGLPAGEDRFGTALQLIMRGDVADGTVQPRVVVVLDVSADDPAGIVEAQRRLPADALALERTVPPLDFAVALRVARRGAHVRFISQCLMKALKSLGMNCGPLSEMILGLAAGKFSRPRCRVISTSCFKFLAGRILASGHHWILFVRFVKCDRKWHNFSG